MKAYALILGAHIGDRRISDVAREWGIPPHILYDGIYENTNAPSAKYLPAVARGLGMTVEELLAKLSLQEVKV